MKKMTEVFIMDLYLSYVTVKSDGFISIGTILKWEHLLSSDRSIQPNSASISSIQRIRSFVSDAFNTMKLSPNRKYSKDGCLYIMSSFWSIHLDSPFFGSSM